MFNLFSLFKSELMLFDAKAEKLLTAFDLKMQMKIENSTSKHQEAWNEDVSNLRMDLQKLRGDLRCKLIDLEIDFYKRLMIGIFLLLIVLIFWF